MKPMQGRSPLVDATLLAAQRGRRHPHDAVLAQHRREHAEVRAGTPDPVAEQPAVRLALAGELREVQERRIGREHVAVEIRDDEAVGRVGDEVHHFGA
jgi:hypothetical protein